MERVIQEIKAAFGYVPCAIPKKTKMEFGKPPQEQCSLKYKFRKGLNGFVYLGYIFLVLAVSVFVYKIVVNFPSFVKRVRENIEDSMIDNPEEAAYLQ